MSAAEASATPGSTEAAHALETCVQALPQITTEQLRALPAETVQALMAVAVAAYAAHRQAGEEFPPVAPEAITATDATIAAQALLDALQVEVFELSMWRALGSL
jgi:hypothetical protein